MGAVTEMTTRVQQLVRPVSEVQTTDIQAALTQAVTVELTRHSPQRVEEDKALTSGSLDLSTLTSWAEGRSRVREVEYPLDETPASYLAPRQWRVRRDATNGDTLLVVEGGSETVRVHYTAPHTLSVAGDTTSCDVVESEVAAHLAAAEILEGLASRWAQKQAVAVAGTEYDGPTPAELTRLAGRLRSQGLSLLHRPALVVGHDPAVVAVGDLV